jgi:hypothetical protein
MKTQNIQQLLYELISLLDSGKCDTIGIDEVWRHVNKGTIHSFLVDRFGTEIDLSYMDDNDWSTLTEEGKGFHNAIDAARKFGVHKRGLCLLMAYTLQSLQSGLRKEGV